MRWLVVALFVVGCSGSDGAEAGGPADAGPADSGGSDSNPDAGETPDLGVEPDVAEARVEPDFSALETELESFVAATAGVDGLGAIIVHRDRGVVFEKTLGAFDADRVYYVASSTKIVTAGIMVKLVDAGVVDLDKPLGDHVDWAAHNAGITPWQLVGNSSGLPGLLSGAGNTPYAKYLCQFIPSGTLQACAQKIAQTEVGEDAVPPATEFRYGGGQWQLAGGLMEAVSGKTWAELVHETYTEPCGLDTFGYTAPFEGALGYPQHLQGDPLNIPETENPNMEAGLYTTLQDYGIILSIHLSGGLCGWGEDAVRVLSDEAVETMRIDRLASYDESTGFPGMQGYGMGWWIDRKHPGIFVDPGAWGAVAWVDLNRGYGVFIAIEDDAQNGMKLRLATQPLIDAALDALPE